MRQNRDIAKANSTQSLRIRNLENETSRLLAENLGLREQIIKLEHEAENGQAQRIIDYTGEVKLLLEAKLLEIGAIIGNLGKEPKPKQKLPKVGRISRASLGQSPDQRNWKNMCTLSEAVAGQDGRLPPILENKSYPRQTLEYIPLITKPLSYLLTIYRRQEIMSLVSNVAVNTTDSPDIGPPPISQFVEDPVKIDLPTRPCPTETEDLSSLDPALSVNLEQRKKKKDSIGDSESRKASSAEATQPSWETTNALKTGAKRKLSVRDDDDSQTAIRLADDSPNDFKFTRGVSEERSRTKPGAQAQNPIIRPSSRGATSREKPASTAPVTARRVLAPKSVNSSPRKNTKRPVHDEIKASKADPPKIAFPKERPRERRQEPISVKPPAEPVVELVEIEPEPETPAGLDLFSPFSSQPSTSRQESRHWYGACGMRHAIIAQYTIQR